MSDEPQKPDIIRPTDDEARALARGLIDEARFCALAVLTDRGTPFVTRVALGTTPEGAPLSLISELAVHKQALRANPAASLLIGEPGDKGDPLTHPRLTIEATAAFLPQGSADHAQLREHFLVTHPKTKLYIDFADFSFVRFDPTAAFLNGGFGRAFRLSPADLGL